MALQSAGTLLYRKSIDALEVLIVRPSGPAARYGWSIPKGLPEPGETLEQAARRETLEETGMVADALAPLGFVAYKKSRKQVHCFTGPAPDTEPSVATWEIDAAKFVPLDEAQRLLHTDQKVFVQRLRKHLAPSPQ